MSGKIDPLAGCAPTVYVQKCMSGLQWESSYSLTNFLHFYGYPVSTKEYRTSEKVQELWQRVIRDHDAKAMVILGALYSRGCDGVVKRDYPLATSLFSDATKLNDSDGLVYLLWMTLSAKKNPSRERALAEVVERIQKSASENIPGALFALGFLHRKNACPSIPKDENKMSELFTRAAELGYALAMPFVGESIEEKKIWCSKAIEAGNMNAYSELANYYDGTDIATAIGYWQKGAEAGDPISLQNLADEYRHGDHFPQNIQRAKELYEKSAAEGDSYAMEMLGTIYADAHLGKSALFWYEKALDEGVLNPEHLLEKMARLCEEGVPDVPPDAKQARKWRNKAAELGDSAAILSICSSRKEGADGVTKDIREARKWALHCFKGVLP